MPFDTQSTSTELTILMPCLNEAETIAICVKKASSYLSRSHIRGEILIADNGSTDGSQAIAQRFGARVVSISERGYGAAPTVGIEVAKGRFVILGDADDSYDLSRLDGFVAKLREGYDLIMGNRFKGGIERAAMPALHRWVGNPLLSFIGRIFFRAELGDFHCGLRGFNTSAIRNLKLRSHGMEFASEMVVRCRLARMRIAEVPPTLKKDGRSRRPHLRTWRDGWRHLRFLLIFSPRWLFFYPGLALLLLGAGLSALLIAGPLHVFGVRLDIHTLLIAGFLCLLGYQLVLFAVFTKIFAIREGFHPPHPMLLRLFDYITLEVGLGVGALMALAGAVGLIAAVISWQAVGFGNLDPSLTMREVIPAVVLMALGTQTVFASFFISILSIER